MLTPEQIALQKQIISELHVNSDFDVDTEIERRVSFLAHYLLKTRRKALVLGISGGVD